jgi:endoglucanase
MRRIGYCALFALMLLAGHANADPPATLRRGVNITNWFRFPPSRDPAALRAYLDDATISRLRQAGFTFVRLAVQSDLLSETEPLMDAVARLEHHGFAVVVAMFPHGWQPETAPERLLAAWRSLAPLLRSFDPARTFPEIVNEPVFADAPADWATLQHEVLAVIRATLPLNTVILTGADWGSVSGLLALSPETDPNVVYSFHYYEPTELTALGAYRLGLDRTAMARLPFPAADSAACKAAAAITEDTTTIGLISFYCALHWDANRITARISEVGAWARRNHVDVIAGEFGASRELNRDSRAAWLAAVHNACEKQGFGWALWGYDDSMGFAAKPPAASRLDPVVLRGLGLSESPPGK